jgi:hypothetical protein
MSAFIVSKAHIDALVTLALHGPSDRGPRYPGDGLTDTVPTTDVNRTDRELLIAALTRLVHGQDTELVTAWARELSDEIPSFEQWCADRHGRAA